jgi:hypothetical protein
MKHPEPPKKDKDGNIIDINGKFYKGRLCGYGKVKYTGGDSYIGMFKDGKRSGFGEMILNQFSDMI